MKYKEDEIRKLQETTLTNMNVDELAKQTKQGGFKEKIPTKSDELIGNKYVDFIERRNQEL